MPVAGHFALAKDLQSQGRLAEAAQEWVAGLEIDPRNESAYLSLADALLELKLFQPASIACQQALVVAPRSTGASHRLATAFRAQGQLEDARAVLQSVCDANSRDYGSRFLLAGVLADLGRRQEAIALLREAIAIQPRFPEALNNLALLLRASGEAQAAETHLRKAVSLRPKYTAAWNNLGNLCVELSKLDDASRCYGKAVSLDPNYAEAHTNRALLSLLRGSFEEGWREYEWRWKQPGVRSPKLAQPVWDGSDIAGKTILLHAEQGAGDTIQFIRYAPLLHRRGAKVLLHCQESLRTLLEPMPELAAVFSGPIATPDFDVHAPLMSLPRIFGTRLESIPGETPYLHALPGSMVPTELEQCREFRVGLVWRGNPNHLNDRNRSVTTEQLIAPAAVEGARFFSLQLGATAPEQEWMQAQGVTDLSPYLSDYSATAACLEMIDLLITVDTSVAHLAGALARPVWMLLPACNDWRWLERRDDTPWYPSMRLFRQEQLRNWKKPITRLAGDLRHEINTNRNITRDV
jgi:tetratricopeptide (TPR) repeat protein